MRRRVPAGLARTAGGQPMERELCGKWMPLAKEFCARGTGHKGHCKSASAVEQNLEQNREYRANHREQILEYSRKYSRKYRAKHLEHILARDREYRGTAAGMLAEMRKNAKKRGNR